MKQKYKLSREMYRGIKQMDSVTMSEFLTNVFQDGFNAAVQNTQNITFEDLHKVISEVKGIGEKRMTEIDDAIKKLFQEKERKNG